MKVPPLLHARSKPPWRVFFFGTDEFSLRTLQALNENRMKPSGAGRVVDTIDIVHPQFKKASPVQKYAAMCGLSQYSWPIDYHIKSHFDVGVLASFGHYVPKKIVELFPYGIINVHPSCLPRWRGAAPLHHTIISGDKDTAVSIMSIKPKHFDVGPLLHQKKMTVPSRCTFNILRDIMAHEGGKLIIDILKRLPDAVVEETQQSNDGATYAHKLSLDRSYIDWENQTADQIDRQYRAIFETMELRTLWESNTVRLTDLAEPSLYPRVELDSNSPSGFPVFDRSSEAIWVKCNDGWSAFHSVVIRKKMSAKNFYNGYLSKKHLAGVCFKSVPNNLFNDNYWKWVRNPRPS